MQPKPLPAVAYYRVSTQRQGRSGLGLEAQQTAVKAYAGIQGLHLIEQFTEVETGTRKRHRPQLAAALEATRRAGAVLLIASLDRLARNVAFVSALMESGVRFVAVDMPEVDNLTIHVMAAVAEREAQQISARTRAALAARKARGLPLGGPNPSIPPEARQRGREAQREAARLALWSAAAHAQMLREQGLSLRAIAARLNEGRFRARQGGNWSGKQVHRLLARAAG